MNEWYLSNLVLIQTSCANILLALSFQVVLRSGVFSFASVGFFGIGAYTVGIFSNRGYSEWLGIAAALAGCGLLGYLLALLLARLRGLYLALVTVAFNLILTIVANNGGELTGGPVGLYGVVPVLSVGTLLTVVVVAIVVVRRLEVGYFGRAFEVLRLDENLARSTGQPVGRYRAAVFCLSAVLGAAAGCVNVLVFTTVTPDTAGFHLVTTGLTMAVLGGIARWQGAVLGALIVSWIPSFLGEFGDYQIILNGILVMLIVVYAPDGIVGLLERGWRRLRRDPVLTDLRGDRPEGQPSSDTTAAASGGPQ